MVFEWQEIVLLEQKRGRYLPNMAKLTGGTEPSKFFSTK